MYLSSHLTKIFDMLYSKNREREKESQKKLRVWEKSGNSQKGKSPRAEGEERKSER